MGNIISCSYFFLSHALRAIHAAYGTSQSQTVVKAFLQRRRHSYCSCTRDKRPQEECRRHNPTREWNPNKIGSFGPEYERSELVLYRKKYVFYGDIYACIDRLKDMAYIRVRVNLCLIIA